MELWCKRWVRQTFPDAVFRCDPRIFMGEGDRDEICDKVGEIDDMEELEKYLPKWQWGKEALLAFWGALQEATDATLQARTLTELKQNLGEWPWNLCKSKGDSELSSLFEKENARQKQEEKEAASRLKKDKKEGEARRKKEEKEATKRQKKAEASRENGGKQAAH